MPMSGSQYVAPTWVNNAPPALDATELQAMSDTIQANQKPVSSAVQLSSAAQSALGFSAGSTLDDALIQTVNGIVLAQGTVPADGVETFSLTVDTTEWSNFDYIYLDLSVETNKPAKIGIYANSPSRLSSCSFIGNSDYSSWDGFSTASLALLNSNTTSNGGRIFFPVLKNLSNGITCVGISPAAYSIGGSATEGIDYNALTTLNINFRSTGSLSFVGDLTYKIWGQK